MTDGKAPPPVLKPQRLPSVSVQPSARVRPLTDLGKSGHRAAASARGSPCSEVVSEQDRCLAGMHWVWPFWFVDHSETSVPVITELLLLGS